MAVYHCFVKLSDAHYSKQLVRGRSISRHAPPCDRDDDGGDDGQALHHELYSWRKNCHVEKFQLSMYDNCGEIPHVEKFQMSFIAIYAVLLLNLSLNLFCREILPQFTRFGVEKN